MARTGLSQSDVTTAYDALREAGINPSIRNIRERLGNTGSLKTIADHVRALHTERWQSPGPALPDSLLQSLVAGAGEFWQELADAVDHHIETNNAECQEQISMMQVEREEATQTCAAMRDTMSAHLAHISTLEKQLAQAMTERADNETKFKDALEATEQERLRADVAEVSLEIRTRELDAEQRERESSEKREQVTSDQHDAFVKDQALTLGALDKTISALTTDNAAMNQALTEAMRAIEHRQAESECWKEERATHEKTVAALQAKGLDQVEVEKGLHEQISTLRTETISLRSRLEASEVVNATEDKKQAALIKTLSEQMKVLIGQSKQRNDHKPQ